MRERQDAIFKQSILGLDRPDRILRGVELWIVFDIDPHLLLDCVAVVQDVGDLLLLTDQTFVELDEAATAHFIFERRALVGDFQPVLQNGDHLVAVRVMPRPVT